MKLDSADKKVKNTSNKFCVTHHAIERYIKRHDSSATFGKARTDITLGLSTGSKLKQKTFHGTSLWKFGNSDITAVVKIDDRYIVCVTILPKREALDSSLLGLKNLNYEEEISSLNDLFDSTFYISTKEESFYLKEFEVILKAKHELELKKSQAVIDKQLAEQELKVKKLQATAAVADIENKLLIMKDSLYESHLQQDLVRIGIIQKLQKQCEKLRQENEASNSKMNNLLTVMITCMNYMNQNKNNKEISDLIEKINYFDPSIMMYQSSFSLLSL